ncbi:MAG: metalloendopeptidase PepO, partial [bacterium]
MKKQVLFASALIAGTFMIYSCGTKSDATIKGIDIANIDTSVRAQDDFYHFANGSWLKNNPVPGTET